jgi:hypothetical protein
VQRVTREEILIEIRRLSHEKGGQPPGRMMFEKSTGIKLSAWLGIYWSKWSDAIVEAGFVANKNNDRISDDFLLEKLAIACRHFGRLPSYPELRLYEKQHPGFPTHNTFTRAFPSKRVMLDQMVAWAKASAAFNDVVSMLVGGETSDEVATTNTTSDGYVYLIQSGAYYKIGRSDDIERRVKEIRIALPDAAKLVHTIKTDDQAGIEAYWHRRFEDRRANGEWFRLSASDVAAFKRRRYQ